MQEMFSLSQKNDTNWGLKAYDVPKVYFDHIEILRKKECFALMTGEKKAQKKELNMKAKREGIFDALVKQNMNTPEPWRYSPHMIGNKGSLDDYFINSVPKKFQMTKFKWMSVPKENQTITEPVKRSKTQLNMKVTKKTFIDEMIKLKSNPNFPIPGSTDYFLDSKIIDKFFPDKKHLFTKKEISNTKKNNLSLNKKT